VNQLRRRLFGRRSVSSTFVNKYSLAVIDFLGTNSRAMRRVNVHILTDNSVRLNQVVSYFLHILPTNSEEAV
jgi:hypothetical protein